MEPKIRLKGFIGDWEGDIIGNIATFSKGRGYSKSDLRQKGNPIILYGRLYTNYSSIISSVDTFASLQKGSVLSKGNEVIIPGSGETPEDIAIASSVEQEGVILGGDLNIVSFDLEKIVPAFAAMGITYGKTHYELSGYAQGKTVVHLHNSSISKGHLSYPSKEEQEAIVIFISTIDSLIQSTSKKIESLKQVKAASLESMFPQEGETTPRVRFKGFEGEWKMVILGEVGTFKSNGVDKLIRPEEKMIYLLNYLDVYNSRPINKGNYTSLMRVSASDRQIKECDVQKNDVFFTPSSETAEDIGYVLVMQDTLPDTCYSYHLMRFRPNIGVFFDDFPNYGFATEFVRSQMRLLAKGVQRFVIGKPEFESIKVLIPTYDEQKKIADYFRALDSDISGLTQRLEKLKQIKSACLDNMFV